MASSSNYRYVPPGAVVVSSIPSEKVFLSLMGVDIWTAPRLVDLLNSLVIHPEEQQEEFVRLKTAEKYRSKWSEAQGSITSVLALIDDWEDYAPKDEWDERQFKSFIRELRSIFEQNKCVDQK